MTEERVLRAFEILLHKECIIEEKGDDAFMYYLFYQLFGTIPYIDFFFDNLDEEDEDDFDEDDEFLTEKFNYKKTVNKLAENCPDGIVYSWKGYKLFITDDFMVFRGTIFHKDKERPQVCIDSIVLDKNDEHNLIYVSIDAKGTIHRQLMPIKDSEVIVEENYNDDCPYSKIEESLQKDAKSSIMLLFGLPGTGKTYLLRKLIIEHPELNFYWLDNSMFSRIDTTEFSEFIMKCKNGVFIMEDCEMVIKDREDSYNTLITPLLQLTDGLIGDSLGLKFICTFNTDLKNVDPALQRKGRCSVSYEFKKLNKDKVQALWNKLGISKTASEDLALCDVLNVTIDNGVNQEKRRVGF